MCGDCIYQVVPDQRAKKKKLRASEFAALLKIDRFNGKYREPGTVAPAIAGESGGGMASSGASVATSGISASIPGATSTVASTSTSAPNTATSPGNKGQVTASNFVRPEGSFRIKDSLKKIAQAEPARKAEEAVVKQEQVNSREAFGQPEVVRMLEAYVATHKPEPIISVALRAHKPDVEGEKIVVLADNQLQVDKLENIKFQIQNFLMRSLKNGFVSLSFQIFDDNTHKDEVKKLYTAGEKFDHFLKLNPVVADLKVIFGLELD